MAVQVSSATVLAPNIVQVGFSASLTFDASAYDHANYAFATRFGSDVPIYAQSVAQIDGANVAVTLTDAMLDGGYYMVTVNGLTGADGVPLDTTANSVNFEGVGLPLWCHILKRHSPSWWNKAYGSTLAAILEAVGYELDTFVGPGPNSAYTTAQKALSLRTATGDDLSVIAGNYGVHRPDFASSDTLFRALIPLLATQRKGVLKIFYDVITVLIGPQATSGWAIYEVQPNRIVIEIPAVLLSGFGAATQAAATYLHQDATVTAASTYPGDYLLQDSTHSDAEVGLNPVLLYSGVNNIVDVINQIKASGVVFSIYAP